MSADKINPGFSKSIFWDVNFDQIDFDAKASFVIERVFERVDVQDIRNCRKYYGDEKPRMAHECQMDFACHDLSGLRFI